MGHKYLTVLTKVFFFFFCKKVSAVYSRLLHCPLIHPVCPSTSPPPNTKFCKITVFIFSWGGGADYCKVPPGNSREKLETMLLWGSSRGRGHKKFITEQCESGEFRCSLWRKLLASFHSFISRYLLIDFQTLFHHGYGCRENVTLGVPLQLSFLEGISPSLSKPLFIFLISCPVVRNWLLWGVKPFVDTFSPCPCLGVATSCSTSLQSLSSSWSFLLS